MSTEPPERGIDDYRDAPEVIIKNLLRDNWTLAVEGLTVDVHMGWVRDNNTNPEVTVANPEEDPINGGDTGYSGTAGDGSGPVQEINGTVGVNAWADKDRTDVNARQAVSLMKSEVERILRSQHAAEGTDLSFISYMGAMRAVEEERDPTMYRYQIRAGYGYHARPE